MTETPVLTLPLLQAAQAQKHVTVNEALSLLDGLTHLRLSSATQTAPPDPAQDGMVYALPTGATGDWAGHDGKVAVFINGGWGFVTPHRGWRAFILDQGMNAIWDGHVWRYGALTLGTYGAALAVKTVETDVALTAGGNVTTPVMFPERSIAFGVTGRVIADINGTATAWDLGVAGDPLRYGNGLGLALNSWVNGPSAPLVYWTDTALEITATGGDFTGGGVRLVAHYAELALPDPV